MEYTGVYWIIYWSILEYIGVYWSILEYFGVYWSILEYIGVYWSILEYNGVYWSILESGAYTGIKPGGGKFSREAEKCCYSIFSLLHVP